MDREWAEKGYAHEYEESSVGGITPKLGMSEKGSSRRSLSQNSGGLGIFGKGKKKRLGLPQRAWLVLFVLATLILISKYVFRESYSSHLRGNIRADNFSLRSNAINPYTI